MSENTPNKNNNGKKKSNPKKENTMITESNPYAKYSYNRKPISDFRVVKIKHD